MTRSFRAALWAGATYPLKLYMVAGLERMIARYGDMGIRYVNIGAGHAAQNLYL